MKAKKIRVFVASPCDVSQERQALAKLVADINQTVEAVAPSQRVFLELVRWETHSTPSAGRPQGVINEQVGAYDIFVGIMWRRFGTPTEKAGSGTEEEFDRAYEQWQRSGKPRIMFYFCQALAPPPQDKAEVDQLAQLVSFRDRLADKALVWEYGAHADFADTVRPHILSALRAMAPSPIARPSPVPVTAPVSIELRKRLLALAAEYAGTRATQEPGDRRTRQLELIATKIRTLSPQAEGSLDQYVDGSTPGERLIAAVFLQVRPRVQYLTWLGERLSEKQRFLGYHSAVALLSAARSLDCSAADQMEHAISEGFKRLRGKSRTGRYRTLSLAQDELRLRCKEA